MSQIASTPSQEVVTRRDAAEEFLRRSPQPETGPTGKPTPGAEPHGTETLEPEVSATPCGKRAADVLLVTVLLPVWLPLLGALMLWVKLDSRGPAVFKQTRLGRGGEAFTLYKLRSMTLDAEHALADHLDECELRLAEWHRTAKLREDPRLTRIGGWLRRSSLDELPQLFNVLRGDMSLVGPRPIRESERNKYGPVYGAIRRVRPGLTGLWQVSGRNDLTYTQRVALDRRYLAARSWWNEIKILARTVSAVLSQRGAY